VLNADSESTFAVLTYVLKAKVSISLTCASRFFTAVAIYQLQEKGLLNVTDVVRASERIPSELHSNKAIA
jgi:hypothetical protein